MVLRGDLRSLNLANVLQDLAQNGQSGALTLKQGDRRRHLWFEKGHLRLVGLGGGHGPSIANGLLAAGKLPAARMAAPDKRGGEHQLVRDLLKRGAVTEADVKAALAEQTTELVCDAFLWTDAEFEFVEGEADDEIFDVRQLDWDIRLPADPIIMEALRRSDEWGEIRKLVTTSEEIFRPVGPPPAGSVDAVTERVFAHFDGERRLRDILAATHLGQFAVFKATSTLLRGGAIQPLPIPEAQEKASAHAQAGRWDAAQRLIRYALEHEPHASALRTLAAQALEGLHRPDEAAAEYRQLLSELIEQKKETEAVAICRKIISLAPRDTFTQERLFQLLLDLGRAEEALVHGEALAASLKRAGLPDRARAVYERLVQRFAEKEDIIEELAEIARQMGDKDEAIALYRKLHARAVARNDEELIIQRSRTLLRLDPNLEDIARTRLEVETGIYRKKRARSRRLKWLGAGALIGGALLTLLIRDSGARERLSDARARSLPLIEQGDYVEVVRLYNDVSDRAAWSFVARDSLRERDHAERRMVERQFPLAEKLDGEGRIPEAIQAVDGAHSVARLGDTKRRAQELRQRFEEHQRRVEQGYRERAAAIAVAADASPEALQQFRELVHPLAVPALRWLAGEAKPPVRKAVLSTLAEIGNDAALLTVILLMGLDAPGGEIAAQAAELLRGKLKVDAGTSAADWEAVVLSRTPRPLQGLASAVDGADPAVEWRLVNVGSEPVEFSLPQEFGPEFRVTDATGQTLRARPGARGEARTLRLRPGEFVGGRANVRELAEGSDLPGRYRVEWTARVSWRSAEPHTVTSLPVTAEVPTKP